MAVTTTESSMRTPPCSGRYTPGSTVTQWPGASSAVDSGAHPGLLVDDEPDAVAGAVHERLGPVRVVDDGPAGGVDSDGRHPGPHGGDAGLL